MWNRVAAVDTYNFTSAPGAAYVVEANPAMPDRAGLDLPGRGPWSPVLRDDPACLDTIWSRERDTDSRWLGLGLFVVVYRADLCSRRATSRRDERQDAEEHHTAMCVPVHRGHGHSLVATFPPRWVLIGFGCLHPRQSIHPLTVSADRSDLLPAPAGATSVSWRAPSRQGKASAKAAPALARIWRTDGISTMAATPATMQALPMMNTAWIPRTDATGPTTA